MAEVPPALKGYRDFHMVRQEQGVQVYTCVEQESGKECIVKEFDFDQDTVDLDSLSKEVLFLRSCRSPNIIECHGAHLDPESCTLYIVVEPLLFSVTDVLRQSSLDAGEGLSEASVSYIIHEVLLALVYLHSEHKVHRDVKASNIFLSRHGRVKLSEFGVASRVTGTDATRYKTYVGTPLWMAPEVIHQNPEIGEDGRGYDESADIWSLGITAIEMATGEVPRSNVPAMRLLFAIIEEPPPELDESFSAEFRDFVNLCLQKNPRDRPSAIDLVLHPFLKGASITHELVHLISSCTEEEADQGEEDEEADQELQQEDGDRGEIVTVPSPPPPPSAMENPPVGGVVRDGENAWTRLVSMMAALHQDRDGDLVSILAERAQRNENDVLRLGTLAKYLMKSKE